MTSRSTEALRALADRFELPGRAVEVRPYGTGRINDTFLVVTDSRTKAILQRINRSVFPSPEKIQANLRCLQRHADRKAQGGGCRLRLPRIIPARDGPDWVADAGEFWRMSSFIEGGRSFESLSDRRQAREVGVALGRFHALVVDLDPGLLHDTLPGFHETPRYLERFDRVRQEHGGTSVGADARACFDFIDRRREGVAVIEEARRRGLVGTRVIHGDPKLDNVLFDADSGDALSLIDLDTMKPGLIHYDLGDCLRSCCNRAGEAGNDGADVWFDPELCRAVLEGYFSETGAGFGTADRALLYDAIRLIPLELGLRFLTDHLEGNIYFKVESPAENLNRAAVQFQLVESVERQRQLIRGLCEAASGMGTYAPAEQ